MTCCTPPLMHDCACIQEARGGSQIRKPSLCLSPCCGLQARPDQGIVVLCGGVYVYMRVLVCGGVCVSECACLRVLVCVGAARLSGERAKELDELVEGELGEEGEAGGEGIRRLRRSGELQEAQAREQGAGPRAQGQRVQVPGGDGGQESAGWLQGLFGRAKRWLFSQGQDFNFFTIVFLAAVRAAPSFASSSLYLLFWMQREGSCLYRFTFPLCPPSLTNTPRLAGCIPGVRCQP